MLEKLLTPADELYDAVEVGDEKKVYESFVKARDNCHSIEVDRKKSCKPKCFGDCRCNDLSHVVSTAIVCSITSLYLLMIEQGPSYVKYGSIHFVPPENNLPATVFMVMSGCMAVGLGYLFAVKNKAYSAHKKYAAELSAVKELEARAASST